MPFIVDYFSVKIEDVSSLSTMKCCVNASSPRSWLGFLDVLYDLVLWSLMMLRWWLFEVELRGRVHGTLAKRHEANLMRTLDEFLDRN